MNYMLQTSFSALVPLPRAKQMFSAFYEPFAPSTWATLFAFIFAMGIFMSIFRDRHYQDFSWLGLFGTIVGQDYSDKMSTGYTRAGWKNYKRRQTLRFFPMSTWHFGVTILYLSYSAIVIDYFLVQVEPRIAVFSQLPDTGFNMTVNPILVTFMNAVNQTPNAKLRELGMMVTPLNRTPPDYFPQKDEVYIDDETLLFLRLNNLRLERDPRLRRAYTVTDSELAPRYRTVFFNKNFPRLAAATRSDWFHCHYNSSWWIDETLIICDFSSDDLQNFFSDDDTDKILKI
jgi:hypothetical protein